MWTALAAAPMNDSERDRSRAGVRAASSHPQATQLTLATVFTEHAPHIWRAVRNLGVREADIEDVCQEIFVIVHRKLPTFEGRSALRTWIYGIALRVVADYRKKAHRKHERLHAEMPESPVLTVQATQEQSAQQRQAWELLDRLLSSLSEDRRRVFVLYEIEQLPMREIALILECPLQTAYSRLEAAREIVERGMAAFREQERAP